MNEETKHERFKRLARQRGERIIKDISVLGNLSNRNNYEYSDQDIRVLFSAIEEELRATKNRFNTKKKREIRL